jgi:aryl-phospho-beta-D-glucosidase BglC (GH1 family)
MYPLFKKPLSLLALSCALAAPTTQAASIWLEAESGAAHDPMQVWAAEGWASGNRIVSTWKFSDYSSPTKDDGVLVFEFSAPEAGNYVFWSRLKHSKTTNVKPYWFHVGNDFPSTSGAFKLWDSETFSANSWKWVEPGQKIYLNKGMNKVRLVPATGGSELHIDKVLFTTDTAYRPTEMGMPEKTVEIENPYKSNAVTQNGHLKLVDGRLKNQAGKDFQLKGISTHGLQWYPIAKKQSVPALAEFFGANVVRLAMYVEKTAPANSKDFWNGYMAQPEYMKAATFSAVDDAIAAGMYVIIDWHIHSNPKDFQDAAVKFFAEASKKYGKLPNVIFEICNEPVGGVNWQSTIKPYAEKVVAEIRKNSNNIIIVGTPFWSQELHVAADDPLKTADGKLAPNVMYAMHYYAASHSFDEFKGRIEHAKAKKVGVFVSEWGSSNYEVSKNDYETAKKWLDYLNANKISWINWSLGTKSEASSILKSSAPISGPWKDSDLSTAGAWLKPYF